MKKGAQNLEAIEKLNEIFKSKDEAHSPPRVHATETATLPRVANHAPAPRVDAPELIVESGQGRASSQC